MPPNKKQVELKPCPFCSSAAKLFRSRRASTVACRSEKCVVQPETTVSGDDTAANDREAVAAWNTRPSPPVVQMGDEVEWVARTSFQGEWAWIDRQMATAKCYRETPHEQAGFQSREAANEMADEYEAAARRSIAWTTERARAAIEALSTPRHMGEEARELRAKLQPIVDCYGVGWANYKAFAEAVGPFILSAREYLLSSTPAPGLALDSEDD